MLYNLWPDILTECGKMDVFSFQLPVAFLKNNLKIEAIRIALEYKDCVIVFFLLFVIS